MVGILVPKRSSCWAHQLDLSGLRYLVWVEILSVAEVHVHSICPTLCRATRYLPPSALTVVWGLLTSLTLCASPQALLPLDLSMNHPHWPGHIGYSFIQKRLPESLLGCQPSAGIYTPFPKRPPRVSWWVVQVSRQLSKLLYRVM